MKDILIFVEVRDSHIEKIGLELLGEANKLKTEGVLVKALLIGHSLDESVKLLQSKMVDEIIVCDSEEFAHYNTANYASVVTDVIKEYDPNIFLVGATSIGRDLAPRVSARINCGLTADCTRLEMEGDILQSTRPAFGGNVFATIICPNHRPQMATVRPGVMLPVKDGTCDIVTYFKWNPLPSQSLTLIEEVKETKNIEKIEESKILVSFGRGIGSDDNMKHGINIAYNLKGTYSCSRALVDDKRVEQPRQVGQTGKTVKPDIYLALGISGAIQHVVGMEGSEYIIAINKDKGAPIFNIADIGIVGDLNQLLPLLDKRIKEEKNK